MFGFITNMLVIYNIQYLYLRVIFSYISLTIIPGLLIMLMLKIRKVSPWEFVVYTIGLSISFLMFAGLAVNWILPLVNITNKPLSLTPLLISFDIILSIFGLIAYKNNEDLSLKIKLPQLNLISKIFLIISIIFPILSVLGAITLNNGGSNYLTMSMLGGVAAYVFLMVLLRNKLNENLYPWSILMMGMSLLLMYSLRSWFITGWDVHQEYRVFQLSKENLLWNMAKLPGNAYNACLSISILPTVLSSYLNINDGYIFKVIFQIIYSFVPVTIFLFLKKYSNSVISYLASFFFMSQFQFMQQMPALMRQEIAFMFFVLLLLILFETKLNVIIRNVIFLILGISMIVSHYSTAYIALFLLAFVYILYFLFRVTENRVFFTAIYQKLHLTEKGKYEKRIYHLRPIITIMLYLFTILWSSLLTQSSGNVTNVLKLTVLNMRNGFTNGIKSENAQSALWGSTNTYTAAEITNYAKDIALEYQKNRPWIKLYNPKTYINYFVEPIYLVTTPNSNVIVGKIYGYIILISKRLIKISILLGVIYLVYSQFKKRMIHEEYIFMTLGCLLLLMLNILIPYISIAYNIERLYQQALVLLSLPAVLGVFVIFKNVKNDNLKLIFVVLMFNLYFLHYSGLLSRVVDGTSQMNLDNSGEDYNKFYVRQSEVNSVKWLSNNYDQNNMIYGDEYSNLNMISFTNIKVDAIPDILPSTIDEEAYVYSSYTNTTQNTAFVYHKQKQMAFKFPNEFLVQNKNIIYNNGDSEIFK